MKQLGVQITTAESIVYEILGHAKHPQFKAVAKLVKERQAQIKELDPEALK